MFDGCDFLVELTQHIPPKWVHIYEGMDYMLPAQEHSEIVRYAPSGWKATSAGVIGR